MVAWPSCESSPEKTLHELHVSFLYSQQQGFGIAHFSKGCEATFQEVLQHPKSESMGRHVASMQEQADPATAYEPHEILSNTHDQADLAGARGTIPDRTIGQRIPLRSDGPFWQDGPHRLIELGGEHLQRDGLFEHIARRTR